MTAPVGKAPAKAEPPKQIEKNTEQYSCQIVLEKTTKEKAEDRNLPTDAFNVFYTVDGKEYLDVTRSEKMVNIFDRYYDKYGPDSVKLIEYGCGNVRPNLWNVKSPERKKRKRRPRIDE
tara:strand:- start:326 stop:682 length:357 start_codon:yes stop_codon:yes gene_type:complete